MQVRFAEILTFELFTAEDTITVGRPEDHRQAQHLGKIILAILILAGNKGH
jgi:hypothetical protein